ATAKSNAVTLIVLDSVIDDHGEARLVHLDPEPSGALYSVTAYYRLTASTDDYSVSTACHGESFYANPSSVYYNGRIARIGTVDRRFPLAVKDYSYGFLRYNEIFIAGTSHRKRISRPELPDGVSDRVLRATGKLYGCSISW